MSHESRNASVRGQAQCPVCKRSVRDCYAHLQMVHPAWLEAEVRADKAFMERAWSTERTLKQVARRRKA